MQIERVYRDSYGTVWMYASYNRPKTTSYTGRKRHHRKKHKSLINPKHMLYALCIFIALFVMIGIVNAGSIEQVSEPAGYLPTTAMEDIKRDPESIIDINPRIAKLSDVIESIDIEPEIIVEEVVEPEPDPTVEECIGQASFTIGASSFTSLELPDTYYPGIDFSSFQPYEDYACITNPRSAAYSVTRSDRAYNDENGLRRYSLTEDQFSIDGKDDYVIALGTFYKPKGTCGQRYLIVTSTGCYTAIAGDEKADAHTDDMHMFTLHCNGEVAGIIEWLVDTDTLNTSMRRSGNIATQKGPVEELKGDILYIYLIEE